MAAGCTRRKDEMGTMADSKVTTMLPAMTIGRILKRGVTAA
jgi:hypothetical protein